jgi:magnesium-transporting ATPase (P-type)
MFTYWHYDYKYSENVVKYVNYFVKLLNNNVCHSRRAYVAHTNVVRATVGTQISHTQMSTLLCRYILFQKRTPFKPSLQT